MRQFIRFVTVIPRFVRLYVEIIQELKQVVYPKMRQFITFLIVIPRFVRLYVEIIQELKQEA